MFASKAKAYPNEATFKGSTLGQAHDETLRPYNGI